MFNFLNSAVLFAAVAAIIPLLIHLFSRRRVKIVEFSSLRHLKQMQKRQVRRLKIRQLLLLILRMLIIFTAVLAFARPATKGGYIGSHAGVSAAVLLDKSASMNRQVKDGVVFDLAVKKSEDILQSFGEADNVILIPYDRTPEYPAGQRLFSRDVAEGILNKEPVGFDKDNLTGAMNDAVDFLNRAKSLNKEIYLITDRQKINLDQPVDSVPDDFTFYLAELPVETDGNCGLTGIDLGGQLIEIGSSFNIKAEIKNYDNFDKTELLASLFIDGTRVYQSEFKIISGGTVTVPFTHTIQTTGYHAGWVELSDDGYAPDNRYYFSFYIPAAFNVFIIDGDGSGELIRLALVPDESLARYWQVKSVGVDEAAQVRLADYDALVLAGVDSLDTGLFQQVNRFVDAGGGVFYIPGAQTDIGLFNRSLGAEADMRFGSPMPRSFSRAGYYTMERFDYTHPIFQPFGADSSASEPVLKYFALPEITAGDNNRKLARFSNGRPALIEAASGLGKYIVMAAPLSPVYTDLASHSFFVPMVIRTLEYLAGDPSQSGQSFTVGSSAARTLSGRTLADNRAVLVTPDGRSFVLAGVEQSGQVMFDCRPLDAPGIYQLKANDRILDMFAVNVSTDESDLAAVDPDQLESMLGLKNMKTLPYDKPSGPIITESRFGRELWKIILWAVVVLVAVEMLLSRDKTIEIEES
jgi:hypothetical protein